jgi:Zn-dependent protease
MGRHVIPLGRILGIPIGLDYSWFLIFVLLTWTLAVGYYPTEFKDWPMAVYWILGAITAIMLFVSVLLHELGHSVIAMSYKIPVRSITLFIFGGIANISAEPPSASAEFWIAIAGPVVSFALAVIFALLAPVVVAIPVLFALFTYLFYINGALVAFNLIPGFPLDGGRVFRAIVWGITKNLTRATVIAGTLGRIIGFLFIILGVWLMFSNYLFNGLWIAFIGWFLESAAGAQIMYQMLENLLAGHKVTDAMSSDYTAISPETVLQEIVDLHILAGGRRAFLIKAGDDVVGLLTLHRIKEVARADWAATPASQVMIPAAQMKSTRPDAALWDALKAMDSNGVNQLPVMSDGRVVGMLTREGIVSFLGTLQEFAK